MSTRNLLRFPTTAEIRASRVALCDALNLADDATLEDIREELRAYRAEAIESFEPAYLGDFTTLTAYVLAA